MSFALRLPELDHEWKSLKPWKVFTCVATDLSSQRLPSSFRVEFPALSLVRLPNRDQEAHPGEGGWREIAMAFKNEKQKPPCWLHIRFSQECPFSVHTPTLTSIDRFHVQTGSRERLFLPQRGRHLPSHSLQCHLWHTHTAVAHTPQSCRGGSTSIAARCVRVRGRKSLKQKALDWNKHRFSTCPRDSKACNAKVIKKQGKTGLLSDQSRAKREAGSLG